MGAHHAFRYTVPPAAADTVANPDTTRGRRTVTTPTSRGETTPRPPPSVVKLVLLLALLAVWGTITIGIAFDAAEVTSIYQYLTVFVAVLASRYWDVPARFLSN
jgi:hypothetical protein